MKKKNLKPMIISALLAVGFGATSVGTSFALFTDNVNTTIEVTAGKVDINALITNMAVYSPTSINEDGTLEDAANAANTTTNTFVNGGTAVLSADGSKITLTNVTPGDKVTFKMNITNKSNVEIKYRTVLSKSTESDEGLFGALKYKIGEKEAAGATNWAVWSPAENPDVGATLSFDSSIELPTTAGNVYQNKTVEITFSVEAVQGNANVTNEEPDAPASFVVSTAAQLQNILSNGTVTDDTAVIDIADDLELKEGETWTAYDMAAYSENIHNLTLNGNNHTIKGLNAALIGNAHFGNTSVVIKDLTLEDLTNSTASDRGVGAFINYVDNCAGVTFNNCHLKGTSTLTGTSSHYSGTFIGYASATNVTLIGCTVEGVTAYGGRAAGLIGGTMTSGTFTFTGCSVKDSNFYTLKTEYYAAGEASGYVNGSAVINFQSFTTSGNTLNNVNNAVYSGHVTKWVGGQIGDSIVYGDTSDVLQA